MAQTDSASEMTTVSETTADDDTLRKRLLSRIAVAGAVIFGLLGGLAIFDVLTKPPMPALPKMAAAPMAPAEPVGETKPAIERPTDTTAQAAAEPEPAAVPEHTETALEAPRNAKPLTTPATPRTASIKPSAPAAPAAIPAKPEANREIARVLPERSGPPPAVGASGAPAGPSPVAQAVETARRFLVQVGVFGNHANAEELVTKLQAAGIPAQIESHVQIGPFASRAEADAARAKLKGLGMDEGMLVRR